jgi:hypothetical protein
MRGVEPNKRMQDLPTRRLLCAECEQRFSALERAFSNKYFSHLQSDRFRELEYDGDLYRFAISLSWRCIVSDRDLLAKDAPQHLKQVNQILEQWRLYLLGIHRRIPTEAHLFVFAGIPLSSPKDSHPKSLHYLLRAVDMTPMFSQRSLASYVKLIRSLFFTPIIPNKAHGWKNTRIHQEGGKLINPQIVTNARFGSFLTSRVEGAFKTPLSEKQADRIDDAMRRNPSRVLQSESIEVWLASLDQRRSS